MDHSRVKGPENCLGCGRANVTTRSDGAVTWDGGDNTRSTILFDLPMCSECIGDENVRSAVFLAVLDFYGSLAKHCLAAQEVKHG